jgi:hypothetical protein
MAMLSGFRQIDFQDEVCDLLLLLLLLLLLQKLSSGPLGDDGRMTGYRSSKETGSPSRARSKGSCIDAFLLGNPWSTQMNLFQPHVVACRQSENGMHRVNVNLAVYAVI